MFMPKIIEEASYNRFNSKTTRRFVADSDYANLAADGEFGKPFTYEDEDRINRDMTDAGFEV